MCVVIEWILLLYNLSLSRWASLLLLLIVGGRVQACIYGIL